MLDHRLRAPLLLAASASLFSFACAPAADIANAPIPQDGGAHDSSSKSASDGSAAADAPDGSAAALDASKESDGSSDAHADAGGLACGPLTCAALEYCVAQGGGPPPLEAGPPMINYTCVKLSSSCTAQPTCACVVPYLDDAGTVSSTNNACTKLYPGITDFVVSCQDDNAGHVTVSCGAP
jgi:hypothetical protein